MTLNLFILIVAAFLPIYLLIRAPYLRLPLHIDTGFYVSNSTIAFRRFSFRRGWNAHYAGCSKAAPELFYSLVYLGCTSRSAGNSEHPYIRSSRIAASLYNYITCVCVAILAVKLGGDSRWFVAALFLYALLSSEPHYGVYHECAEIFEVLAQAGGTLCLLLGIEQNSPLWITAGTALWSFDVFFIKLSSAAAAGVLFAGVVFWYPASAMAALLGVLAPAAAYIGWIRFNGQSLFGLIPSVRGHEASFSQRPRNARGATLRILEKARCALDVFRRQPILPMLALAGILFEPMHVLVRLWLLGVLATYVIQSTDCRYYLILFQAPLVIFAAAAAVRLLDSGPVANLLLAAAGMAWLYLNPLRAMRLNRVRLNEWIWQGFRPRAEYARNLAMERACKVLRPIVAGDSVLVYGPHSQAYVLLDTSWPTPIVAPEQYLELVYPPWQCELNRRLIQAPPKYILDTSSTFDGRAARDGLGLDYRLIAVVDAGFRLFRFEAASSPPQDPDDVRTFRPQSAVELASEEERAAHPVARHTVSADLGLDQGFDSDDPVAGIRIALATMRDGGHRRVALYGAGRFTIRHAETYRGADPPIRMVLDDDAARFRGNFLDWPVYSPEDAPKSEFDSILVSSDRYEAMMVRRARRLFGDRFPVFTISGRDCDRVIRPRRRGSQVKAIRHGDAGSTIRECEPGSREAELQSQPVSQGSDA
jgi:hypothetical protein